MAATSLPSFLFFLLKSPFFRSDEKVHQFFFHSYKVMETRKIVVGPTILFQSIEPLLVSFDRFVAFILARLALRLY